MNTASGTICYVCGSYSVSLHKSVHNFDVYKCGDCKLLWAAAGERAGDVLSFYNAEYFSSDSMMGYRDYLADEANHRKNAGNIIRAVSEVKEMDNLRVLDIGCAFGFLLDECRKLKNCDVYGIEISSHAREHARGKGINVVDAGPDSSTFERDFFDIVFLIGTIEHLVSPGNMLHEIRRILKTSGLLVITTVDTAGIVPLYSIKPPEHLFYFDRNNINLLLGRYGYEKVIRNTYYVNYCIHDLLHRLKEFSNLKFLGHLASLSGKLFPHISLRIPTNEMLVIAKKT